MKLIIEGKPSKKKKIFILKRNAGDVAKGIQMFNNSTDVGSLGASTSGMGESLLEGRMKDLYMDVEDAGGKDRYIEKIQRAINKLNSKLNLTFDDVERLNIEDQIKLLQSKIAVVNGNYHIDKKSIIDRNNKEIYKLQRELAVDSNDYPYDWGKYNKRRIDKLKKQNDDLMNI